MLRFGLFCLVIVGLHQVYCKDDYYWRIYTGSIPDDAFVAGRDVNGKYTYVGQAYTKDGGLVPGQIFHGVKEIEIPWGEATKKDQYINILCGPQVNFRWLRTNTTTLHLDLLGTRPIIGGWYEGFGYYYIARIFLEGSTIVGKIHQFEFSNPIMDFVVKHVEDRVNSFEVLHYVEFDIDARISVVPST